MHKKAKTSHRRQFLIRSKWARESQRLMETAERTEYQTKDLSGGGRIKLNCEKGKGKGHHITISWG